ncbi:urease accessory protein UreD, partial [Streptomyces purpurogeneiscleroticus]
PRRRMMTEAVQGGSLRLDFACAASGVTELVERSQRFPLHVTSALRLDPAAPNMAFVYLQNPSGGVFEGDMLAIDLRLRHNASVHVSTPSATKLFGAENGVSARQRMTIDMQAGAYLEYVPD